MGATRQLDFDAVDETGTLIEGGASAVITKRMPDGSVSTLTPTMIDSGWRVVVDFPTAGRYWVRCVITVGGTLKGVLEVGFAAGVALVVVP